MTTPKQPATAALPARQALMERYRQYIAAERDAMSYNELEAFILAIEAEAAAGMSEQHSDIVALREALTEAAKMRHEYGKGIASGHDVTWETCFVPICAKYRELLRDTAPAATEGKP
jgi:hypothetical protein